MGPTFVRGAWLAVGFVAAIYGLTLFGIETRGLWGGDNGVKFLQVRAIADSGYRTWSLPWPGSQVDPALRFAPLREPFCVQRNGHLYAVWSPVFPVLTAPFYQVFGFRGLYVLPLLGGLGALLAVAGIAAELGLSGPYRMFAVAAAGLATPLWFYSVNFWEHTLAVCAALWALWAVLRSLHLDR